MNSVNDSHRIPLRLLTESCSEFSRNAAEDSHGALLSSKHVLLFGVTIHCIALLGIASTLSSVEPPSSGNTYYYANLTTRAFQDTTWCGNIWLIHYLILPSICAYFTKSHLSSHMLWSPTHPHYLDEQFESIWFSLLVSEDTQKDHSVGELCIFGSNHRLAGLRFGTKLLNFPQMYLYHPYGQH